MVSPRLTSILGQKGVVAGVDEDQRFGATLVVGVGPCHQRLVAAAGEGRDACRATATRDLAQSQKSLARPRVIARHAASRRSSIIWYHHSTSTARTPPKFRNENSKSQAARGLVVLRVNLLRRERRTNDVVK
jgi:hypothetical protein